MTQNIGAFILAAGFSSRMGDFKPLMRLHGRTLVEWTVDAFRQAGLERIVVISGHRGDELHQEARRCGVAWVHNPDPAQGMFSSVRCAVRAAHDLAAFFLLPVDIPLVRPATIRTMRAAWSARGEDGPVLYPVYAGERGHPPLIPARLIADIVTFSGEGGLKALLATHPGLDVPVWDRGVLLDADTGDDFVLLQRKAERLHIGEAQEILALAALSMPERGVAHGQAVAKVAVRLGEALRAKGHALDVELLHNAALVHDIAKGHPQHEQRGGALLDHLGLTGLAPIVASHRVVPLPDSGLLTERVLVCLADKLVRGPLRITIQERFQEKLDQYRDDAQACAAIRGRRDAAVALQRAVEQITGQDLETLLAGVVE